MSSSDSSSSDSDLSDNENMDDIVNKALGVMKQNLMPVSDKNKTKNNKTLTNKHRFIYETFNQANNKSNVYNKNDDNGDNNVEFFIDKRPKSDNDDNDVVTTTDINVETEKEVEEVKETKEKKKKKKIGELSSELKTNLALDDVYIDVDPLNKNKIPNKSKKKQTEPEIMKKSVISEDFEKYESIATTHTSVRQLKKQRKLEREKTKGGKWFNMPATEVTDERKYDLSLLQMRKALDPKRFYKANDLKTTPKFFQFGTVVEDASDFYSSRIPKKQRKSTIVEELLADAEFRKFNKRKYTEVQDLKRQGKGPYKHMKRLKKSKK